MLANSSKSQRSTSPFRSRKGSPAAAPVSPSSFVRPGSSSSDRTEFGKPKENVTVTVRFRPLSARELKKGDETAWYADGECTVRNEDNPNVAYAFDRVFGPATTTRHVYDVAAHRVVSGAMQGVNGTVFAYGVTSSGKTHTMHGEQKSPGVIPLAVKDIFEIIQETPEREFLLRVSYLEIYNEVINDLLDPTGQNLRIREDKQGTYIEGIKEEVVLSPAHALSLIATGEEFGKSVERFHELINSTNGVKSFDQQEATDNALICVFLTIESSPHGQNQGEEDVTLSQLHLIDLAGSESSKTETNGLRRKEGSYINKSLLTLGTVISKLTDGKATHIPYRDSKLTRLLQSSLSGNGRISLICTVTPASSNSEETHNTLKFAHRSKHVEIKASQNRILDEKSLIKKYQKEISNLKQELQSLKNGRGENPCVNMSKQEDLVSLKLQQEAGQVKSQSGFEEEEQTKAALMGRIQRLTKLILVSTKNSTVKNIPQKSVYRRRRSFGEDELAYLPDRKREHVVEDDDDDGSLSSEVLVGCRNVTNLDEMAKDHKKNKRKGMLGWFKSRKPEHLVGLSSGANSQSSASGSPASCSTSSLHNEMVFDGKARQRKSFNRKGNGPSVANSYPETCSTIANWMDLLNEQVKILAGEIALCTRSLKRLSEQAVKNQEDSGIKEQMQKLKNEIKEKKMQIHQLEQRTFGSLEGTPQASNSLEMSQALAKLATQLNETTIELEIKSTDNRILQEKLQMKVSENAEIQETILLLRQQLSTAVNKRSSSPQENSRSILEPAVWNAGPINSVENMDGKESPIDATTPTSVISLNRIFSQEDTKDYNIITTSNSQAADVEKVKQENVRLSEEKDGLELHNQKLAEEASYAKELAAAAAVELRNLTEEVAKLSDQNSKLIDELDSVKEASCRSDGCQHLPLMKQGSSSYAVFDSSSRKPDHDQVVGDLQKELDARNHREALLKAALSQKEQVECELQKQLNGAKRQEKALEDELANMWGLIANMGDSGIKSGDVFPDWIGSSDSRLAKIANTSCLLPEVSEKHENNVKMSTREELMAGYLKERRRSQDLERLISRLKGEDLIGLDVATLEELQNVHVEAITKICQAKYANHIL